jgi:methyl-accepting chemotaxis protein
MKNLTIGGRLLSGFGIVIFLSVVTSMVGIASLTKNENQLTQIQNIHKSANSASNIIVCISSIVDATKAIALTDNPEEKKRLLGKIGESRTAYKAEMESLKKSTTDKEGQQALRHLEESLLAGKTASIKSIELAMNNDKAGFLQIYEQQVKAANEVNFKALRELQEYFNKESLLRNEVAIQRGTQSKVALFCASIFATIIGIWISIIVTRSITRPVHRCIEVANRTADGDLTVLIDCSGKDETAQLMRAMQHMVTNLRELISGAVNISSGIATASIQLHQTSSQIATGAEGLAMQTNTVATASEEMSATSVDIARTCTMAADASQHSTEAAIEGARVVQETIVGMSVIADRVRNTSQSIEQLGSRSEHIGDIVGTIEDIADQTNLLALNAAIEAARAGEQGRGFAVVADEVRALAERTTKATREIGEMIKTIQNETKAAVKAMELGVSEVEKGAISSQKSGHALEEILSRINDVSGQVAQIATAAEEQTATTGEVTGNITQITELVQLTARGAIQNTKDAEVLSSQAMELQNLVGRFRLA